VARPTLGEALRRIGEGACLIRSKGEAGTGNVVEAVRHLRTINAQMRRLQSADASELFSLAKDLSAPLALVQEVAATGKLPVPLFCAGGISNRPTPRSCCNWGPKRSSWVRASLRARTPCAWRVPSSKRRRTFAKPGVVAKVSTVLEKRCAAPKRRRSTFASPNAVGNWRCHALACWHYRVTYTST